LHTKQLAHWWLRHPEPAAAAVLLLLLPKRMFVCIKPYQHFNILTTTRA
jgi:hypothetical protein